MPSSYELAPSPDNLRVRMARSYKGVPFKAMLEPWSERPAWANRSA
jgi:hypothetical protein